MGTEERKGGALKEQKGRRTWKNMELQEGTEGRTKLGWTDHRREEGRDRERERLKKGESQVNPTDEGEKGEGR